MDRFFLQAKALVGVLLLVLPVAPALALKCDNNEDAAITNDGGVLTNTVCGHQAEALGQESTVVGHAVSATAGRSVVVGTNTVVTAAEAVAIGADALAGDFAAIGIGRSANAEGEASIAMGNAVNALGLGSIALGDATIALKEDATAIAYNAVAEGFRSLAIGPDSHAGDGSIALGTHSRALATDAVAIGPYAMVEQSNSIVLGSSPGVNGAAVYTDVGIGLTEPAAPLHVARNNGTATILVTETSADVGPRTLFELMNNGNPEFRLTNLANNNSWSFSAGLRFVVKNDAGEPVMRITDTGGMEIGGTLLELSDRDQKHAIEPLSTETVLEKLVQVPVSEWSYKGEAADQRHIGPMAQDFHAAFGLASGETAISARDMAGVNMAAVQALQQRNTTLEARVEKLEAMLRNLLPEFAAR